MITTSKRLCLLVQVIVYEFFKKENSWIGNWDLDTGISFPPQKITCGASKNVCICVGNHLLLKKNFKINMAGVTTNVNYFESL